MSRRSAKFGNLLTEAVHSIARRKHKTVNYVQDQLGHALGRRGGSAIEYWRRGYIPAYPNDIEQLARELTKQQGLNCTQLEAFLLSAAYPDARQLLSQLCPSLEEAEPVEPESDGQPSPFVVGVPIHLPGQFFGRDEILTEIFRLWRGDPLQSGAVVGLKRTGKTSLLHYVRSATTADPAKMRRGQRVDWLGKDRRLQWAFVDFQDPEMRHQESLLRHLLTELKLPIPDPCKQTNFNQVVGHQLQKRTVILVDEFEKGISAKDTELDQDFWEGMRALVRKTRGKLGFLLAAQSQPDEFAQHQGITSPFFNIFHCLSSCELGPFTEEEAHDLINHSPVLFNQADQEWILTTSQLWPAAVQILCYHRLAALEDGHSDDTWQEKGHNEIKRTLNHLLK